jgi:hypothetical protein
MLSFAHAILSFFKRRPPMDEATEHIFDPGVRWKPNFLLYILRSWAELAPDPQLVLSQIVIKCVMLMKMPCPPEHEFLILEVVNKKDTKAKAKLLILERTIGNPESGYDTTDSQKTRTSQVTKFLKDSYVTLTTGNDQWMEEGTKPLTARDKMSVISIQALNTSSESLNKNQNSLADDLFLDEDFVFHPSRHGQCMKYFQPRQELSLFDLALIADAVHKQSLKYTPLKKNCYFYAAVVYAVAKVRFDPKKESEDESSDISKNDEGTGFVYVSHSRLSDRFGCWNGMMMDNINPEVVKEALELFESDHIEETARVMFYILS